MSHLVDGVVSTLEPAHTYHVRLAEGTRTGPAIQVSLPAEVVKVTNITEKMSDKNSCNYRGKSYKIDAEWYDECLHFCVCVEGGKNECVSIECPTDFGLDLLDRTCLDWETVPADFKPQAPNCCPQVQPSLKLPFVEQSYATGDTSDLHTHIKCLRFNPRINITMELKIFRLHICTPSCSPGGALSKQWLLHLRRRHVRQLVQVADECHRLRARMPLRYGQSDLSSPLQPCTSLATCQPVPLSGDVGEPP